MSLGVRSLGSNPSSTTSYHLNESLYLLFFISGKNGKVIVTSQGSIGAWTYVKGLAGGFIHMKYWKKWGGWCWFLVWESGLTAKNQKPTISFSASETFSLCKHSSSRCSSKSLFSLQILGPRLDSQMQTRWSFPLFHAAPRAMFFPMLPFPLPGQVVGPVLSRNAWGKAFD